MDSEILKRFEKKFTKTQGCWNWEASGHPKGYGQFWVNGKYERANRAAYRLYKGEIPEGLIVCHSCDNPKCVNPRHLWVGTNSDNQRDRVRKGRHREANKTHCPSGHEYTEKNTKVAKNGWRQCRECNRKRQREYIKKTKGNGVALPPFPDRFSQADEPMRHTG